MNIERLNHLITILENVRDAQKPFDLRSWLVRKNSDHACNTTACALGYAALDPVFQAQGLTMVGEIWANTWTRERFPITSIEEFNRMRVSEGFDGVFPVYEDDTTFEAAAKFFDILPSESDHLFDPYTYDVANPQPQDVIDRIHELIRGETEADTAAGSASE